MREVEVIGVGMTQFGRFPDVALDNLGAVAIRSALTDASLQPNDVQVVYAGHARTGLLHGQENGVGQVCCSAAGIRDVPVTGVGNFCASGSTAFREAWIAVGSGLYDIALAFGVEKLSTRPEGGRPLTSDGMVVEGEMGFSPPAYFALLANRYLETYGIDSTLLAKVAVKNRRHAHLNPLAHYRVEITVEDVLDSPMIATPLTRLSCCPTSDGAAAAILVDSTTARRLGRARAIRVLASGLASSGHRIEDMTHLEIDRRAARTAYEYAGIGPSDIDLAEVHDAFTISEIIHYEDLGFCDAGAGVELLVAGDTALGGALPISTSGGLLSRGHPLGATGIAQVAEIVTQLRGEAGARQVEGARVGLAHCVGGFVQHDAAASAVHLFGKP